MYACQNEQRTTVLTVGPGFPGGPTAPEGPGGPLNENQTEVKQVFNTPYITNTPYQKKRTNEVRKTMRNYYEFLLFPISKCLDPLFI